MTISWQLVEKLHAQENLVLSDDELKQLIPCLDSLMLMRMYETVLTILDSEYYQSRKCDKALHYRLRCFQQLAIEKRDGYSEEKLQQTLATLAPEFQMACLKVLYADQVNWHGGIEKVGPSSSVYSFSRYRDWLLKLLPKQKKAIVMLIDVPDEKDLQANSSTQLGGGARQFSEWSRFESKQLDESLFDYYWRLKNVDLEMPPGFKLEIYQTIFPRLLAHFMLNSNAEIAEAVANMEVDVTEDVLESQFRQMYNNSILPAAFIASQGAALLFEDLSQLLDYLHDFIKIHPHETSLISSALRFKLPPKGDWTQSVWRELVMNRGQWIQVFIFKAPEIEQKVMELGETVSVATLTRQKLVEIIQTIFYSDLYEKYPHYIRCCILNGMPEAFASDGLSILHQHQDKQKVLPEMVIKGQAELGNYYFTPISNETPRPLMLGMETGCCQRYDSEFGINVVYNGITMTHHGFYAVLKQAGESPDPETDEVKVQSYAWLGANALVIDSMEAMRPQEIKRFLNLYREFFKEVLGREYEVGGKQYKIERIVIGSGGKTPKDLSLSILSEKARVQKLNGNGLGDASKQYLAAEMVSGVKKIYAMQVPVVENSMFKSLDKVEAAASDKRNFSKLGVSS